MQSQKQSVRVAALFTVLEIIGLLIVVAVAFPDSAAMSASLSAMVNPAEFAHWNGILLGAVLAFYAYIGFEDMVNVAEEVRDPVRSMPRAILAALSLAMLMSGDLGAVRNIIAFGAIAFVFIMPIIVMALLRTLHREESK